MQLEVISKILTCFFKSVLNMNASFRRKIIFNQSKKMLDCSFKISNVRYVHTQSGMKKS